MKKKFISLTFCFVVFYSCVETTEKQYDIKVYQIRDVIKKSGFIKLPLEFDAMNENYLKRNYEVDFKGNDSLLFDSDVWEIIGFLPDTSNYYAFLFYSVGDMLYPTVVTMDKNGNKIDRNVICAGGCAGHAAVDIINCYDSVLITKDLNIRSISKLIGTVETEDSTLKIVDICNMRKTEGFIDKTGKIKLTDSGIIICNE